MNLTKARVVISKTDMKMPVRLVKNLVQSLLISMFLWLALIPQIPCNLYAQDSTKEQKHSVKVVKVAAVQLESLNNDIPGNLRRAQPLLEAAASQGAQLVLLPEFYPSGYSFSPKFWESAEPQGGPTTKWLCRVAADLKIYIGTSFLEAEGEDFYNSFILAGPDGKVTGQIRKAMAFAAESFYFRPASGPRVIETELGRIGVGICFENRLDFLPRRFWEEKAEIILMPFCAPAFPSGWGPESFRTRFQDQLKDSSVHYAQMLGVPAIYCNKSGLFQSPMPVLPFSLDTYFPGGSNIVDSDGRIVAQLGKEPGIIVAEVRLDESRRTIIRPPSRPPRSNTDFIMENVYRSIEPIGKLYYSLSNERRNQARMQSK